MQSAFHSNRTRAMKMYTELFRWFCFFVVAVCCRIVVVFSSIVHSTAYPCLTWTYLAIAPLWVWVVCVWALSHMNGTCCARCVCVYVFGFLFENPYLIYYINACVSFSFSVCHIAQSQSSREIPSMLLANDVHKQQTLWSWWKKTTMDWMTKMRSGYTDECHTRRMDSLARVGPEGAQCKTQQ